jgi:DNA-binding MarR family transcriptional regulator
MSNNYEKIQTLINLWAEYEKKCGNDSMHDFGRWLSVLPDQNSQTFETTEGQLSPETADHLSFYKQMPPSRQFLTLLSRSARFIDFYMKKAFEGLAISSRLEFQFLITIKEMKNPRKTDVIYFNLVELSTGVETLNRLKKNKLIRDYADDGDKRIKRLALTGNGEELVGQALQKFSVLDQLTLGFGNDESWKSFIPSLIWFNDFHNEVYRKHRSLNFEELCLKLGMPEI